MGCFRCCFRGVVVVVRCGDMVVVMMCGGGDLVDAVVVALRGLSWFSLDGWSWIILDADLMSERLEDGSY